MTTPKQELEFEAQYKEDIEAEYREQQRIELDEIEKEFEDEK